MYTQEQILQRLASLTDQRERLSGEVALLDNVIHFWQQQLDTHNDSQDTDIYSQMFGENETPTLPTVSYTYTDTPMQKSTMGVDVLGTGKV